MISFIRGNRKTSVRRLAVLSLVSAALVLAGFCADAAAAKKPGQETFASPEEAAGAFFQAIKDKDARQLVAILGKDGKILIHSGDPVADIEVGAQVLKLYEEQKKIVRIGDRKAILELGAANWPLPIPLVEEKGRWRFDTKAGKEEILNRRIGKNELSAIEICRAYVDAQKEYAASHSRDGGSPPAYAQKFFSEPGKRDGLYWEAKQGEPQSPVGIFMANAKSEGYTKGQKPIPYHGYFFKILKAQGQNARGGAYDYVVRGKMIGGFALVAYPAKYGASGVMTFIVNHQGVVYEKDLGSNTAAAARSMKLFDPGKTWRKVN